MDLQPGRIYQIEVTGEPADDVPKDAIVMLQGLPEYFWRCIVPLKNGEKFSLVHTLTQEEIEKWTTLRITTNDEGASVPLYIDSISVFEV